MAISSPVTSVWVNPRHFKRNEQGILEKNVLKKLERIAQWLKVPKYKFKQIIKAGNAKRFIYLKRRINPQLADEISALQVPGVYFEKEFKRYYPAGSVSAHVVGFTDIDDVGQEGIERGYEQSLKGVPGKKRVIRDGKRQVINYKDLENIKNPVCYILKSLVNT